MLPGLESQMRISPRPDCCFAGIEGRLFMFVCKSLPYCFGVGKCSGNSGAFFLADMQMGGC